MENEEGNTDKFEVEYDADKKVFKYITTIIEENDYVSHLKSIKSVEMEKERSEEAVKLWDSRIKSLKEFEAKAIYLREEHIKEVDADMKKVEEESVKDATLPLETKDKFDDIEPTEEEVVKKYSD